VFVSQAVQKVNLPPAVDVVGLPIRPLDADGLVDAIISRAGAGVATLGCYANAHTVNLAWSDPAYRRVLTQCDMLIADGASVVWAGALAGSRLPCRLTAMDFFPILARRCAEAGLSIYLLGGHEGIAEKAADRLRSENPGLNIVGSHQGHFTPDRSDALIEKINAARPDILAVGMSCPRQEKWLNENAKKIAVPVRWCVGALFDYLAGQERRAPAWLCRLGGEWLFRLAMDPVGKWRRYLIGNPRFLWNVLRWRLGRSPGVLKTSEATVSA
jgi:N-acetylglucosaminyldiphosphoundecaprenol N-acetyl-beta-D-mannosaminyltransferase